MAGTSPVTIIPMPGALGELMPEKAVLDQWPCLSREGLRAARAGRKIAWVKGKRGTPFYRPSAVRDFIANELERRVCLEPEAGHSLNSGDSGSQPTPKAPTCIDSGLSPELAELAARASAQRILGKQN